MGYETVDPGGKRILADKPRTEMSKLRRGLRGHQSNFIFQIQRFRVVEPYPMPGEGDKAETCTLVSEFFA